MNAMTNMAPFSNRVRQFVISKTGVSADDLCGSCRKAELVEARALFVWIVRHSRPRVSYPVIGRWLGGRDHSTIINLHMKAIRLRLDDADFELMCEDWLAHERHIGEVPYGCA